MGRGAHRGWSVVRMERGVAYVAHDVAMDVAGVHGSFLLRNFYQARTKRYPQKEQSQLALVLVRYPSVHLDSAIMSAIGYPIPPPQIHAKK